MTITETDATSGRDSAAADASTGESGLRRLMAFELTSKKVSRKDLMHFSRQLAVFVKAGIPLLEALETITEEMGNKTFRAVLQDVHERLSGGGTLASAAAAHPEAFPDYYVGILRSAELTGTLDEVLIQLSGYIERDLEARRKVTSALMYPAIIAVMAVVVVIVLVGFVLPRFEVFFKNLGAKLPLPTRMLLSASHALTTYWYVVAMVFLAFIGLIVWMMKSTAGRRTRDKLILRMPVLGDLVEHALLERFCRILSSMMQAGVPLPEAMAVTSDATSNHVFKTGLNTARDEMMRGAGFAEPLNATGLFPSAARQMFRVGERTGSLDNQLLIAADYFDRELDYKIKRFTALFEPIVIVAMGGVVGFVAVALISAMYGIFRTSGIS